MTSPASLADLVHRRYGHDTGGAPAAVSDDAAVVLRLLLEHKSVRRFLPDPVDDGTLRLLVAAAQSASSSSHMQSWSVVVLTDRDRIRFLAEHAGASGFVADAPMVLLFVVDWARGARVASWQGEPAEALDYLESTLVGFVDAGIAAQNAVVAAEALGLGTCYLGSLRNRPAVVAEHIGLPERSVVAFGVALGHPDPTAVAPVKPRLAPHVVAHPDRHRDPDPADVEAFDETLDRWYEGQGRPGPRWSDTLVARVRGREGLHGRDAMRDELHRRGLPSD